MHRVRTLYRSRRLPTVAAFVGVVVLLCSVLSDGHITASEWARIGGVLFLVAVLWGSHITRANPQDVREQDYRLGYEQGRRDERRSNRQAATASSD